MCISIRMSGLTNRVTNNGSQDQCMEGGWCSFRFFCRWIRRNATAHIYRQINLYLFRLSTGCKKLTLCHPIHFAPNDPYNLGDLSSFYFTGLGLAELSRDLFPIWNGYSEIDTQPPKSWLLHLTMWQIYLIFDKSFLASLLRDLSCASLLLPTCRDHDYRQLTSFGVRPKNLCDRSHRWPSLPRIYVRQITDISLRQDISEIGKEVGNWGQWKDMPSPSCIYWDFRFLNVTRDREIKSQDFPPPDTTNRLAWTQSSLSTEWETLFKIIQRKTKTFWTPSTGKKIFVTFSCLCFENNGKWITRWNTTELITKFKGYHDIATLTMPEDLPLRNLACRLWDSMGAGLEPVLSLLW